ncbi:MAG: C-terminal binding protein [Solirubrobacterales bacterium]
MAAQAATKVLVTDYVFEDLEIERSILEPLGCELVEASGTSEEELVAAVEGATAMLVCYATVTEPVIAAAGKAGCKIISRYGIGYDNIDVDAARSHRIVVTYVPDYCLDEVADHTMALLLSLARGVVDASRLVAKGEWSVPQGRVHRLQDRRLAVIGVGGIGRRVIDRAGAFGLRVVGFDPFLRDWEVPARRATSFDEAIADADMITLHVPMTAENHHLIDAESIAAMNNSPLVVNTARGGLVDMDAAADAVESGRLGGIGLDVTENEPPPPDHPLRNHPRAVLTPHMGFYSVEAQAELQRRAAEEVARMLRGEPPDRPVNAEVASGA